MTKENKRIVVHVVHTVLKMLSFCKLKYRTIITSKADDDDEIAYFTVRWKTRASFVYRTKNMR